MKDMYILALKYSWADKNKTTDVTTDQNTKIPCGVKVQRRGTDLRNRWRIINIARHTKQLDFKLKTMHAFYDGFFILLQTWQDCTPMQSHKCFGQTSCA